MNTESKEIALKITIHKLEKMFPGKTMLNITETAQAYGLKNPQSIYNALRSIKRPFPVKPIKRCGKWYWNIVLIAEDMISQ